jgi:integrase
MSSNPNTSLWTITQFNEKIVIPKKAPGKVSVEKWYRWAVKHFVAFAGRDIKCRDVTMEMLDNFVEWLRSKRLRDTTAYGAVSRIRAIIHMWNPELFPNGSFGSPLLNFADAETAGTLENIFMEQYVPENVKITSQRTVKLYGQCFRIFSEYLGHTATIADLTDANVGRFMRWVVDVRGNKAITASYYGKRLKAIWNWAAKKRMVAQFPTIANLPVPESIPSSWTREELAKLMAACHRQKGKFGRIPVSQFWVAFHLVLWNTGERYGAMRALRWEWLDLRRGFLSVPAEFRKGGLKAMVYQLKPETIEALRAIRSPHREIVFDMPSKGTGFYHWYEKLIRSAGLKYVPHKSGPQKMRRSFASFIEAAGGNATKALRHSDRRTTEKSYLDPTICDGEPENKKLFPLDGDEIGGAV